MRLGGCERGEGKVNCNMEQREQVMQLAIDETAECRSRVRA